MVGKQNVGYVMRVGVLCIYMRIKGICEKSLVGSSSVTIQPMSVMPEVGAKRGLKLSTLRG